jgi:insertion element IS1 protein InsB
LPKRSKKTIRPIAETIQLLIERPILELDELWSFVVSKRNPVWIWLALERQSRRIVGISFGDRSADTCKKLWESLPADYRKRGLCYSDLWEAYSTVIPSKRHRPVDKASGQTNHVERVNNTLRQRCPNLVRKTLSFSKDERLHEVRIRTLIDARNRELSDRHRAIISQN